MPLASKLEFLLVPKLELGNELKTGKAQFVGMAGSVVTFDSLAMGWHDTEPNGSLAVLGMLQVSPGPHGFAALDTIAIACGTIKAAKARHPWHSAMRSQLSAYAVHEAKPMKAWHRAE